jgi:hypothetical protein
VKSLKKKRKKEEEKRERERKKEGEEKHMNIFCIRTPHKILEFRSKKYFSMGIDLTLSTTSTCQAKESFIFTIQPIPCRVYKHLMAKA